MKHKLLSSSLLFNCRTFLFLFFILNSLVSNAQLPPAIEWQNISWGPDDVYGNPQTQVNSGEDWWFDQKNVYDGTGKQTGYVTVGYSSLIIRSHADYLQDAQVFNEGPGSPYNPVTAIYDDFTSNSPEGCGDRDYAGEHRTKTRGQLALNDLDGNIIWSKSLTIGELGGVVQSGNYIYVVGLHVGVTSYNNHSNFIRYNPTASHPNDKFNGISNDPADAGRKLYVAKIDMAGNIVWEGFYGTPIYFPPGNPLTALQSISYGYSIIQNSAGNLVASGYADLGPGTPHQPFVVEVEPINGFVVNKNVLPLTLNSTFGATPAGSGESHAITEIGSTLTYAVASTYYFGAANDFNEAVVTVIDNTFSPVTTIRLPGDNGTDFASTIFDIKYRLSNGELLIPVVLNCTACAFSNDNGNSGEARIYHYSPAGASIAPYSLIGPVTAYDLRAGVCETTDGGFIAVSSQKSVPTPVHPSPSDPLGYLATCPLLYGAWDTDPIVVKFNATGVEEWRKTFDITPGRVREAPLGDLKQQECLYKIIQSQDGGYVVSGNSSYNFDDNYLFKLYNDCNSKQTYTVTDPTDNIIDITGSVTWSGTKFVLGSVRVLAGATLTIDVAANIQFADSKTTGITTNIDVQKGGRLFVKTSATLTSIAACPNSMWDGIIIEGTTAKQLPTSNQGLVNLHSCEINNARKAIFVGGIVKNSGGILQATQAIFRNNFVDVDFAPYEAPPIGSGPNNISFFTSCNFIGDAFLKDPIYTNFLEGNRLTNSVHVILRGVKGIRFNGNNFKTDLTGVLGASYSTDSRSYGIYSLDASFTVSGTTNNFNNLYYGVYAQTTNPLKTITVDQTNFTNCYFSLYQSGNNYATITKNNFLINTTIAAPVIPVCAGSCPNYFDYFNQCSGFNHSENNFTVTSTQKVVGSIFNNTGANPNETYHNYYTGLKIGTQTQLTNGINASPTGLQIKCNENAGVTTSDIASTSGVIANQGICVSPTSPAGNEFSTTALAESDIKVSSPANNFIYSYQQFPLAGPQIPLQITPVKVATNPCSGAGFSRTLSCPLPVACGYPCWYAIAINNSNLANTAKQVLLAGDASTLYSAISSSMSAGTLKNLLISKSPYLSDGVLIAYLQRMDTPPSGNLADVILSNSPVTSTVKTVLDNMSLPSGIINQINIGQVGVSARKQQEDLVAYYESQKQLAIDGAIRSVLNDTIISNPDSIIKSLLIFDGSIKSKITLTNLYISNGDFASAQLLIDNISSLPDMNKHGKMLQHQKDLYQANKDWFEINNDALIKSDIEDLSSDSLADGFANARSIMAIVKGSKNYDMIEDFVEDRSYINTSPPDEVSVIKNSDNNVKLNAYPNPFKNEINVTVNISQNIDANTFIELIEPVTGRIIQQQLILSNSATLQFNTEKLSSGIYLIGVRGTNINPTFIKIINIR